MENEFDNEIKYKLFRNVREILHPTISKKNISDYKIIIDEDILPVRVFYPKKITGVNKVIIYIHGNGKITNCEGKYSDICKMIVRNTNHILIAIEYPENKGEYLKVIKKIFDTFKFLYTELERNDIEPSNIVLMGDSTGGNIITGINYLNDGKLNIIKELLFYPILDVEKYIKKSRGFKDKSIYNYYHEVIDNEDDFHNNMINASKHGKVSTQMFLLVGNADEIKKDILDYADKYEKVKAISIPFSSHGFLANDDKELEEDLCVEFKKILNC